MKINSDKKTHFSKPDLTAMSLEHQWGEFSVINQNSFDKHLKRLHKACELAKKKFPCLKGKEKDFIKYVLSMEPIKYTLWAV